MYVWEMSLVLKDMERKEINQQEKQDMRRGTDIQGNNEGKIKEEQSKQIQNKFSFSERYFSIGEKLGKHTVLGLNTNSSM